MAIEGYKVGEVVRYRDAELAVVRQVLVIKHGAKQGMYVLNVWKDGKQQADVCVQDRNIARVDESRAA